MSAESRPHQALRIKSDDPKVKWLYYDDRHSFMGISFNEDFSEQDEDLLISWGLSQRVTDIFEQQTSCERFHLL